MNDDRMTREEATQIIAAWLESSKWEKGQLGYIEGWFQESDVEAFRMAIEALQDDWIPVSEPPKENGNYIVSLEDSVYPWGRFFNGKWFMLSTDGIAREFAEYEVRAWQPLPAPYKESEE